MFKKDTKIISIDVSSICYADCVYCLHQRQKMIKPHNIKPEIAREILDIINKEGFTSVVTPLTGEAFCNPAFYKILQEMAVRHLNTIIATKLFVPIDIEQLTMTLRQFQRHRRTLEFAITLDSMSRSTMKKISPGIHLSVVMENIQKLRVLRESFMCLKLSAQTVVTRYNENQLDDIRWWAASKNIPWTIKQLQYYMSSLASKGETTLIKDAYPSDEKYQQRFGWEDGIVISKISHCPSLNPAISLSGKLLICCMDMLVKHPIGNVLTSGSIRSLLESDKFQEMSALADRRELSICKDCN